MYTIDREVVQRQMEDMRKEIEQYRLGKKALKRKRKERNTFLFGRFSSASPTNKMKRFLYLQETLF